MRCDSGGKRGPHDSCTYQHSLGAEEFRDLSTKASLRAQRVLDKQQLAEREE